MNHIFWCKNCLNASTRPRITFDKRGWCNACQWSEEKKTLDWGKRRKELSENKTWNKFISQAINFIEHQESKILLPASFSKIQ